MTFFSFMSHGIKMTKDASFGLDFYASACDLIASNLDVDRLLLCPHQCEFAYVHLSIDDPTNLEYFVLLDAKETVKDLLFHFQTGVDNSPRGTSLHDLAVFTHHRIIILLAFIYTKVAVSHSMGTLWFDDSDLFILLGE